MSDNTPNLQLPYILPDQAQKHVTHNEALQRLDGLAQITLTDILAVPPASAASGDSYGVGAGASGLWFGHDGDLALFQDGGWLFTRPKRGWLAWLESRAVIVCFDGAAWTDLKSTAAPPSQLDLLGINARADATNRLAIASDASLFDNAGSGHQLKINKKTTADTASLLYQTGYSGRAEIGLAGNNSLSVKTSADGASWNTGLVIDPDGVAQMPNRPVCRASLTAAAWPTVSGSLSSGVQMFSINQGGFAQGAALATGKGNLLKIPKKGLYLLQLACALLSNSGLTTAVMLNQTSKLLSLVAATSSTPVFLSGMTVVSLEAGDLLSLQHTGTANIDFGPGKTEICLIML